MTPGESAPLSDEEISWTSILPSRFSHAATDDGRRLVDLCQHPPPLQEIRLLMADIERFDMLPVTPPARAARADRSQATVQGKLEAAMHCLVGHVEYGNLKLLLALAGLLRSSWEDLHQQRRASAAGNRSWLLEPRPDRVEARLFSSEEE